VAAESDRVIVAGAGPVGLVLTLRLAQSGVPVTLLEAAPEDTFLDQVPRAGSNQPATLEMLAEIGLYDRLEARGLIAPRFQYWDRARNERIAEFDHAAISTDTRFPYVLQCERIKLVEEAMAMATAHPACEVLMGTALAGFTQDESGVTATVTGPGGETRPIEGAFIVGAEGARSVVRKTLGIPFEGFTYADRVLNIIVAYDFARHGFADRNYLSDPEEWANLFHWKGPPEAWRVHFPADPDASEESLLDDGACQARLQRFLPSDTPYEIVGRNLYTVHQRVAARFRGGRALLAGDSAHVNSPIGGMGMNSGIHDAMNLGGKLVDILHGDAALDLLDRYERQRRHVALATVQAQTIRNKRILAEKDPEIRRQNHETLRRTAEDPKAARDFILRASLIESVREAAAIQ
jgi:3-(3-hydroxy-phenyl)propionate hydroxylase